MPKFVNTFANWRQRRHEARVSTDDSYLVQHGNWILTALVTSVVLVTLGWVLFFAGRWSYRHFHHNKTGQPVVVQPQPVRQPESTESNPRPSNTEEAPPTAATAPPVNTLAPPTTGPSAPTVIPRSGPED